MRTITIAGNKGGTGKTSTCQNLAVELADRGFRVLTIDADSQGNLTDSLGVNGEELDETLHHALRDKSIAEYRIGIRENIDLVPANVETDYANIEFATNIGRLRLILKEFQDDYDFCLIDTCTYLTPLTKMGAMAGDYIITPVEAGSFSVKGAFMIHNLILDLNEEHSLDIKFLGVVLNRKGNTKLHRETQGAIEQILGKIFNTQIRSNIKINEAQCIGKAVVEKYKSSNGAKDFKALTDEILGVLENDD